MPNRLPLCVVVCLTLLAPEAIAEDNDSRPPEVIEHAFATLPEGAAAPTTMIAVEVQISVSETGAVTGVTLAKGVGEPFDAIAVDTAKKLRFRPALRDGQPVAGVVAYTVEFLPPLDEGEVIKIKGNYSGQRSEVGKITLAGDELILVPGTLGDPIRVVTLLPGVTTSTSGLGYPIIRGALPGESRFEIDGIEIPMLFHFLVAGAVVHPRAVGDLTFEPGGFGVERGRAIGGRVGATLATPGEQRQSEVSLSLVDAGGFYSDTFGQRTTLSLSSRYGTLGLLAKLVDPNVTFQYFDYQARVTHKLSSNTRILFTALGALDIFNFEEEDPAEQEDEDSLDLGFHRLEARLAHAGERLRTQIAGQFGKDVFQLGRRNDASTYLGRGNGFIGYAFFPWLELTLGGDFTYKWASGGNAEDAFDVNFAQAIRPDRALVAGTYARAELTIGPLTLEPGVRFDYYDYETVNGDFKYDSWDPRLLARLRWTDAFGFRAGAGVYHGMSELTIAEGPVAVGPVPASDGLASQFGLSRSHQFQLGGEFELPGDFQATLTGYYTRSRHALDYSLLLAENELTNPCTFDDEVPPELVTDVRGENHGVEFLFRRKLGGKVSGWLAATYSRSRRELPGLGKVRYSYDQPLVVNGTLLFRAGKWHLGATGHVHTGRPYTAITTVTCDNGMGPFETDGRGPFNAERLPTFWRVDLRAERRWQFANWQLSLYLDFFNASLQKEALDLERKDDGSIGFERLRLFLPMLGARGEF